MTSYKTAQQNHEVPSHTFVSHFFFK